jgi:hypothetical protein
MSLVVFVMYLGSQVHHDSRTHNRPKIITNGGLQLAKVQERLHLTLKKSVHCALKNLVGKKATAGKVECEDAAGRSVDERPSTKRKATRRNTACSQTMRMLSFVSPLLPALMSWPFRVVG